jgi:hypothetical protein
MNVVSREEVDCRWWRTYTASNVSYDGCFGQQLKSSEAAYQALSHKSHYTQTQVLRKSEQAQADESLCLGRPKPIQIIAWLNKVYQIC